MDEYLALFLAFIDRTATGSMHTSDAYRRDIQYYPDHLVAQDINDLDNVDKHVFMAYRQQLNSGALRGHQTANSSFSRSMS